MTERLLGNKYTLGIKMTNEQKQKLSDAQKGRVFSDEHKSNLSIALKGARKSQEHIAKISRSLKGKVSGIKGKRHTDEVKKTMSDSAKGRARVECPHCNKIGDISNMKRHHFTNCKLNNTNLLEGTCLPRSEMK